MISPPACYGKLPALGDYLRHKAAGEAVSLWWNRFANVREMSPGEIGKALPWCFVLAPDVFSWAEGVHVVGVIMLSRDRIGRGYPFVVWQKASDRGLRHASLFHPHNASPRNWLFWLSRLVFAHVRPIRSVSGDSPADFPTALEQLWSLFKPTWSANLGISPVPVDEARCHEHIGPLETPGNLEGVHFMPWANWPELLWEPRSLCWFWQQDHQGRYLRVLRDHHFDKRVLASMMCEI